MSNGNDDWGNSPGGGEWGDGGAQQPGAGQPGAPQPGAPQPGAPQPGPGQPQTPAPGLGDPGQTAPQQGGFAPTGAAQNDLVHQKKGGADKLETNDFVAIAVNFFLPGVGHMILGQTTRGIVIFALFIFTCGGWFILQLAAMADAYFISLTQKYREVGDWEFFPDHKEHI